jgi:hypothetical protein
MLLLILYYDEMNRWRSNVFHVNSDGFRKIESIFNLSPTEITEQYGNKSNESCCKIIID